MLSSSILADTSLLPFSLSSTPTKLEWRETGWVISKAVWPTWMITTSSRKKKKIPKQKKNHIRIPIKVMREFFFIISFNTKSTSGYQSRRKAWKWSDLKLKCQIIKDTLLILLHTFLFSSVSCSQWNSLRWSLEAGLLAAAGSMMWEECNSIFWFNSMGLFRHEITSFM